MEPKRQCPHQERRDRRETPPGDAGRARSGAATSQGAPALRAGGGAGRRPILTTPGPWVPTAELGVHSCRFKPPHVWQLVTAAPGNQLHQRQPGRSRGRRGRGWCWASAPAPELFAGTGPDVGSASVPESGLRPRLFHGADAAGVPVCSARPHAPTGRRLLTAAAATPPRHSLRLLSPRVTPGTERSPRSSLRPTPDGSQRMRPPAPHLPGGLAPRRDCPRAPRPPAGPSPSPPRRGLLANTDRTASLPLLFSGGRHNQWPQTWWLHGGSSHSSRGQKSKLGVAGSEPSVRGTGCPRSSWGDCSLPVSSGCQRSSAPWLGPRHIQNHIVQDSLLPQGP